jgi:phospho-N-acetylmuramoyl-pentapeptide-transferase
MKKAIPMPLSTMFNNWEKALPVLAPLSIVAWIALFGMLSFGLIGFFDDYAKMRRKQNQGLTVRQKFGLQVLAAMFVGFFLLTLHSQRAYSTNINVPFFKSFKPDLLIDAA